MNDVPYVPIGEVDDVLGFCVPFLLAGMNRDFEGMDALLADADDLADLLTAMAGIANKLGINAFGRDQYVAFLTAWEPGRGIPGIHRPPD